MLLVHSRWNHPPLEFGSSFDVKMPKERNFNPVQAQRKADKAKAIKKGTPLMPVHGREATDSQPTGKAEVTTRRNERLAKRNPERISQQIDDLKAITSGGGKLTRHEEQVLEGLEKELKAVTRARDSLGDKAPAFHGRPRDGAGGGVLGKRRRDGGGGGSSSESDVPEDVRRIPMPRDTPPPIPKAALDRWYEKRRAARSTNANMEPLGEGRRRFGGGEGGEGGEAAADVKPAPPPVEAKTVYEAKPVVRDLRKEAVSAFVPTAVRMKIDKGKGKAGLLDPEEADRLEQEGYLRTGAGGGAAGAESGEGAGSRNVTMEDADDEDG